jgi:soluble lytic murein transglycosylase
VVTKRSSGVSRSKAPRAADAMNKPQEARAYYEQAARYSTAYYGQLARVKLGLSELALASSPVPEADKRAALANSEIVRAIEILYATDQRDLVVPIAADLAERGSDLAVLAALGEQMAQHEDARCTLLIGRGALGRGHAFDDYAFPTFGLLRYTAIAPEVELAVVYSIARQESGFNAKAVSNAHALGLMQVTPQAGQNNHQEVQRRL